MKPNGSPQKPLGDSKLNGQPHPIGLREGNSPTLEMVQNVSGESGGERNETGRFITGNNGGPGRPKGARNKLSEAFLQTLADDFDANGKKVIEQVRAERPHDYLKVCASVMPKRLENEDVSDRRDVRQLSTEELEAFVWKSYRESGVTAEDLAETASLPEETRAALGWRSRR